jgi:hypothetical protein
MWVMVMAIRIITTTMAVIKKFLERVFIGSLEFFKTLFFV